MLLEHNLNPHSRSAEARLFDRGLAYLRAGSLTAALDCLEKVARINPAHSEALHLLGVIAEQLGDPRLSADLIGQAIGLKDSDPTYHYHQGLAYQKLGNLEEAVRCYQRAVDRDPRYSQALSNMGVALQRLNRLQDAVRCYERSLQCDAFDAPTLANLAEAHRELYQFDEAILYADRAISINPALAQGHFNRGVALQSLQRFEEAIKSFSKALEINPDYEYLEGTLLMLKTIVCDWKGLDDSVRRLQSHIIAGKRCSPTFAALSLYDDPSVHLEAARTWARHKYLANISLGPIYKRPHEGRIRIGYYSADFHDHATSYLIAELLEKHDRNQFELFGFSFGPDRSDEMRKRVSRAFDQFVDATNMGDTELALLSRNLNIDIAVDLKGYTQRSRAGIFSCRAAPIQINYLGYPGTMGADFIDYIIADNTLIPFVSQKFYTEKIIYMPNSYQPNDRNRIISNKRFDRFDFGLPDNAFVFCCFNNNYKIMPPTFDIWMRIMRAVPHSVLWLLEDNASAAKNLRKEASARGVDDSRLIFAKRIGLSDHLARHRLADLFLDTLPCNAHTTTSDALWAGLPVLTCSGQGFAGRVAASLVSAVNIPELVAENIHQYELIAIELAQNPQKLSELKVRLVKNRLSAPLFDTDSYTAHLELAYKKAHELHINGHYPRNFHVI